MKKKIFLIEDNEQNRDLAIYLLERRGYEVIPASDGALGIEMAVGHQPQLILFDTHLSSMDGISVALALGRHPDLQSIPIVALTSQAQADDREKTIVAGCSGHMAKRIDPETFVAEVERYLLDANRPCRRTRFWSWMTRRTTRARVAPLPSWGV
jgi:two-component system, cell cycle response regulator DivK